MADKKKEVKKAETKAKKAPAGKAEGTKKASKKKVEPKVKKAPAKPKAPKKEKAQAAPPVPPEPPKKLVNHFALVFDDSGSMGHIAKPAERAFNDQLAAIVSGARQSGQEATISTYLFGSGVKRIGFLEPIDSYTPVKNYRPDQGGTALFDGAGEAIEDLLNSAKAQKDDASFVVTIITDGGENASRKFGNRRDPGPLLNLMRKVMMTDRWTINFLLPKGEKAGFLRSFPGFPEGNVAEWETTSRGVAEASTAFTKGVTNFYENRAAGKKSTDGFFSVKADLTNLDPRDVRAKLDDVSTHYFCWDVPAKTPMRQVVERHGQEFKPKAGRVFYQLVEREEVQEYKEVLVFDTVNKRLYGGDQARNLIDIPQGQRGYVSPGNLGAYRVFIQSTSSTRNIDPNTQVYYRK